MQAEQQHNVNSAGTSLLVTENKEWGSPLLLMPGPLWSMMPREVYRNCLFPVSQSKLRLEDCKAWVRACGPPDNNNDNNNNNNNSSNNNNNNNNNNDKDNNDNNSSERRNSNFFTISSLRREPSPTRPLKWLECNRVQITCNTSSAYHVQHVVLRATW